MSILRSTALVLSASALLFSAGCSEQMTEVSGTVFMDGSPLPEGEIIFEAADAQTAPAVGQIKDGKYTLKIVPGAKKVRINASRKPLKPDPVLGDAVREPMVQPQFNTATTLAADVTGTKQDGVDFQVKSIPR